jgi:hypothetical protein
MENVSCTFLTSSADIRIEPSLEFQVVGYSALPTLSGQE